MCHDLGVNHTDDMEQLGVRKCRKKVRQIIQRYCNYRFCYWLFFFYTKNLQRAKRESCSSGTPHSVVVTAGVELTGFPAIGKTPPWPLIGWNGLCTAGPLTKSVKGFLLLTVPDTVPCRTGEFCFFFLFLFLFGRSLLRGLPSLRLPLNASESGPIGPLGRSLRDHSSL